jgi:hypothetical protein
MNDLITNDLWEGVLIKIGLGMWAVCAIILLWYAFRATTKKGSTDKYDYVAKHELKYFKIVAFLFAVGAGFFMFGMMSFQFIGKHVILLYFVGMVSIAIAFLIGYVLEQYFKVYYPFFLEKKLGNIRFHPRNAPNGQPMKLLREHEEDAHMTQNMIDQEELFTFDYDVWLEEESNHKVIERYEGHLSALVCPRCEFRTMKDYKEQVLVEAQPKKNGRLRIYYRCSYCTHEEIKDIDIASEAEDKEMLKGAVSSKDKSKK